jgi:type IV secretion system protein VirB9
MKAISRQLFHCLLAGLIAGPAAAEQKSTGSRRGASPLATEAAARTADTPVHAARVVQYGDRDVVPIHSKVRYTTLIVLPESEEIIEAACGDKEFWVVEGAQNLAYVKPTKERSQTNLNLVTASGRIYSFALSEISAGRAEPDLKVFVQRTGGVDTDESPRRFVSARELEHSRRETETAREETRRLHESSKAAIEAGVSRFITNVRFAYRFEAGKRPFYVRAMYHDNRFTYIQARPEETPTLYEMRDGTPNLVNFDYKDGIYVATKVLDEGYLVVGKKRLHFKRAE